MTTSVKLCIKDEPIPFDAVNVMLNVPLAVGDPPNVPVPLPLSVKKTPPGRAPVSVRLGAGNPVVVTENEPAVPTMNDVLAVLVNAGD